MPWELTGNTSTNPATDFLGTTDGQPLVIKTSGSERMRLAPDGKVSISSPVSIGTTEASTPLTVAGGAVIDGVAFGVANPSGGLLASMSIGPAISNGLGCGLYSDGPIWLHAGEAEPYQLPSMMIHENGNVSMGHIGLPPGPSSSGLNLGSAKDWYDTLLGGKPKGKLHISSDGHMDAPQLRIEQTDPKGWARIRLNKANKNTGEQLGIYWDIAVGGDTTGYEVMNFYTQDFNVMTLTHEGNVSIGIPLPEAKLHISSDGQFDSPQVHINQTRLGDFARLQFSTPINTNAEFPSQTHFWDIAVGNDNQILNFYSEQFGNVMQLTHAGELTLKGDIILTNADCAEEFDIEEFIEIEPGTVMVLDQDGVLHQSEVAYDKRVAGVISGAGDYKPGLILDKQPLLPGRKPIALVGKVYCKVDAGYAPIEVGDLLTTSPTLGYAMKAEDMVRAFGAIIGKALRPLQTGQGMIPILIALQ